MKNSPPSALLQLLWSLARREWIAQYNDTIFGLIWTLLSPLLSLFVYTVVFTQFFKVRWPNFEQPEYFALNLFVGLILHNSVATTFNRASSLIVSERATISNVTFSTSNLVYSSILATIPQLCGSLLILAVALLGLGNSFFLTWLIVPFLLIPFYVALTGFCLVIASSAVYIRDLSQIMPLVTTLLLFLSPVFYSLEMIPAKFHDFIALNFLTHPIEMTRGLMLRGELDLLSFMTYSAVSIAIFLIGKLAYEKLSRGFIDVL